MEILTTILLFLPLLLVLLVANAAQRARERDESSDGLAVFTWILLVAIHGMMALLGAGTLMIGSLSRTLAPAGEAAADPFGVLQVASPALLGWGLLLPALVGLVLLLPGVRRALSAFIPIDPTNIVHAASLSLSMLILVNMVATLGIGLGNLVGSAIEVSIWAVWVQALMMVVTALVGVGWPIRRTLGEARVRLGIQMPTMARYCWAWPPPC